MTTLEQVEKLREKANVSYDEAKSALDAANGDLLEALIYLEKQGKVKEPEGGGYYSSEKRDGSRKEHSSAKKEQCGAHCESFKDAIKRFAGFCGRMIQKGNVNTFEVLKGEEVKGSFPVTVLVLLLIFAFWITIPLIVIGLFFGLRYRFHGPDLGNNPVNRAMDSAANAAESFKNSANGDKK